MIKAFVASEFPQGLPAQGTVVDATALSTTNFNLSGVNGALDARKPQALQLSPGQHKVWIAGAAPIPFTVDSTGVVDYAPDLTTLAGRGTHTLTVTGVPVGLDATALSYPNIGLSGHGWWSTRQVQALRLLPGAYTLVVGGVGGWPVRVTAAGQVDFDNQYATFLSGEGTATLTVTGLPVTIDATAVSYANFNLSSQGWWSTRQPQKLRLLPGTHTYIASGSADRTPFVVTPAGLIDYDDSAGAPFSGRGTTTLKVLAPTGP
jgi:hypothetical protein